MLWDISRGFLPNADPVQYLAVKSEKYQPFVDVVEKLAASLTSMVDGRTAREEIVSQLRDVIPLFDHDLFNSFGSEAMDERAFLVYGYFAAIFINNHMDQPLPRLCKEVTIPIVRLAERVQRKPTLDYCSYVLYNWRRKLHTGPLSVENLEPLLTFSDTDEEKRYITSRVVIEAKAKCLTAQVTLEELSIYLSECIDIIRQSPHIPHYVESYFKPFVSIKYEGWGWTDPQTFAGNAITQSSTIGKIAKILGLPYQDAEIMDYKPVSHRMALQSTRNLRANASEAYNECLVKFIELFEAMAMPQTEVVWSRFNRNKKELLSEFSL